MDKNPLDTSIKILKLLAALCFLVLLSVLPFCLYMEHLGNVWLKQQWALGREVKHEGLEFLFLFGFGLYSIPFLFWTANIFRKPTVRKFFGIIAIVLLAVIPALLLNYFFYGVFSRYHH